MALPKLSQNIKIQAQTMIDFKGLNLNPVVDDGELIETYNLSSKEYPCLAPRYRREVIKNFVNPSEVTSFGDKLFYIDDNKFYYNDKVKGTLKPGKKSIAVMNDHVVIFPDKVSYDSIEDTFLPMEVSVTVTGPSFTDSEVTITGADFIKAGFKVGDAVEISGCSTHPYNNRSVIIQTMTATSFTVGSNVFEPSTTNAETGIVTFKRAVPDMDFVFECNNRLWGCKDGKMIYSSMQGNHFNFNVFQGLVTDSYFVEVGTPGKFTGVMTYNNYPYFFKEEAIHKIYGFSPSQFQVITMNVQGVKEGCERSLAVTNNLMFYVARDGVMLFDATSPQIISEKLRYEQYDEAVAGGNRKYYYVCLRKGAVWHMYCYDSDIGLWHKQDDTHALCFNLYKGKLIYLNAEDKNLYEIDSEDSKERIHWEGVTGEMNPFFQDKKGIIKLKIRVELEANSSLSIFISHDNGPFIPVKALHSLTKETKYIPIQPQRCDYFKVKFVGDGECKIYHIIKEFYQASEV